jgi:hypothetical protein
MSVAGVKETRRGTREGPSSLFGAVFVARLAGSVETLGGLRWSLATPPFGYLEPACAEGSQTLEGCPSNPGVVGANRSRRKNTDGRDSGQCPEGARKSMRVAAPW